MSTPPCWNIHNQHAYDVRTHSLCDFPQTNTSHVYQEQVYGGNISDNEISAIEIYFIYSVGSLAWVCNCANTTALVIASNAMECFVVKYSVFSIHSISHSRASSVSQSLLLWRRPLIRFAVIYLWDHDQFKGHWHCSMHTRSWDWAKNSRHEFLFEIDFIFRWRHINANCENARIESGVRTLCVLDFHCSNHSKYFERMKCISAIWETKSGLWESGVKKLLSEYWYFESFSLFIYARHVSEWNRWNCRSIFMPLMTRTRRKRKWDFLFVFNFNERWMEKQ